MDRVEKFRRIVTVEDERAARKAAKGLVSIIDDDPGVLVALHDLIEYEGYACNVYRSVAEFLDKRHQPRFPGPRCILTDMCMPDMDGLQLQEEIGTDSDQPFIFMSGLGSVGEAAQAFRNGAINFLSKPVVDSELFRSIEEALTRSADLQRDFAFKEIALKNIAKLSPRELEVAKLLPEGLANLEMADRLGVSERAVKLYKKNVLEKLEMANVYELAELKLKGLLQRPVA